MQQAVVDLPPEVARMANQAVATGGTLIGRLADMAQQMGVPQVRGRGNTGHADGMCCVPCEGSTLLLLCL
jgi:hypothetical protein